MVIPFIPQHHNIRHLEMNVYHNISPLLKICVHCEVDQCHRYVRVEIELGG